MKISKIFEFYIKENKHSEKYKGFFISILDFFGNTELNEISEKQISKFLALDGLKISSQKVRLAYAAVAVNFAKKKGFIKETKNPFRYCLNKQEQLRMRNEVKEMNLNYAELNKFINFVSNQTLYNMCKLAINTGMSSDEICSLQWRDIRNGSITFNSDKAESHCRKVPLLFETRKLLNKMAENANAKFVFMQKDGKPYTAGNLSRQIGFFFAKFKREYPDTKHITFHAFHHAYAKTCQLTDEISKDVLTKCCSQII